MRRFFLICEPLNLMAIQKRHEFRELVSSADKLASKYMFEHAAITKNQNGTITKLAGLIEPTSHADTEDYSTFIINGQNIYVPKDHLQERVEEFKNIPEVDINSLLKTLEVPADSELMPTLLWTLKGVPVLQINDVAFTPNHALLTEMTYSEFTCLHFNA